MKREIREEVERTQEHQQEQRYQPQGHQQEKREKNKQIQNIALATGLAAAGGFGIYYLANQMKKSNPEKINMNPEKQRKAAKWIKDKFNEVKQDKARIIKID